MDSRPAKKITLRQQSLKERIRAKQQNNGLKKEAKEEYNDKLIGSKVMKARRVLMHFVQIQKESRTTFSSEELVAVLSNSWLLTSKGCTVDRQDCTKVLIALETRYPEWLKAVKIGSVTAWKFTRNLLMIKENEFC